MPYRENAYKPEELSMLTRVKNYLVEDYKEFLDSKRLSSKFLKNIFDVLFVIILCSLAIGLMLGVIGGICLVVYSCEYFGLGLGLVIDVVSLTILGTIGKTMYEHFCA